MRKAFKLGRNQLLGTSEQLFIYRLELSLYKGKGKRVRAHMHAYKENLWQLLQNC